MSPEARYALVSSFGIAVVDLKKGALVRELVPSLPQPAPGVRITSPQDGAGFDAEELEVTVEATEATEA